MKTSRPAERAIAPSAPRKKRQPKDARAAEGQGLSRSEFAYRELRRRILDNELPAGIQMLELEIADALGVSRTPAREAMVRLARDGLVEIRPRHGMRVLPVSADDMREIYEILTALEPMAAGLAAARGLSDAELLELNGIIDLMDDALARDDLRAWAWADERFHARLTELSGNRRLSDLVAQYFEQTHRVRMLTLTMRPKPEISNRDHAKVVAAIAAGDADAARRLHRAHRERSGRLLVSLLRPAGL